MSVSARDTRVLHDACAKGKLRAVKEILQKGGDVVSLLESRVGWLGYTPLHAAACQGHADILSILLIYGGDVNVRANGNYTPLHISAAMGYVPCIEILLKNNADIRALDDFRKTPYQTASQQSRKDSAKTLKSAEIIQAAKDDSNELRNLLNEISVSDITKTCFNDALIEASHFGNFDAVQMLLVTGATNIRECITISLRRGHYRIVVLLLICFASFEGNITVLENLLQRNFESSEFLEEFIDNNSLPRETLVGKIRECLTNHIEGYTRVPIQLLAETKTVDVLKVLLLNTSCARDSKKVNWSMLSLVDVDLCWIEAIMSWVQELDLSGNKLTTLPARFVDLNMVVKLNLSANKLRKVPLHIFNLVRLRRLNISSNSINDLPETLELKPALKSLNLSNNNLSSLPQSIAQSCLETLNISRNNFSSVPLVVCEITSLKDLDLSDNREIDHLPVQMGKLRNLTGLKMENLEQITDPPERMRQKAQDLVSVLRKRLRACEPYYKMKMMLVGKGGQGKTTLVHRLQEDYTFRENDLTQGVEISDLVIKGRAFHRDFTFKVWDFGGQEDYYATHQCFLSSMALYLLVWRLIDGEEGVNNLTSWLDNIAVRSPGSTVIIVGTHLDCITSQKHGPGYVAHMKFLVQRLVKKPRYNKKVLVPDDGIVALSCAFGEGRTEITNLRRLIYDTAAGLKKGRSTVMGEWIPFSFFGLIDRLEKRRMEIQKKNQPPIIKRDEFHAMVQENSQCCRRDVADPHDLRDATIFLRERGIIMHFDDPNKGLNDLYFIDPRWLCSLMARVITVKGPADLVQGGILEVEKSKMLFRGDDLPFDFYAQYIQLLVGFQIAYLLDETRLLVPSKLPEKEPELVNKMLLSFVPIRRAYCIDYHELHGFWPRFISRFFFYMKEMIGIDPSRYQKSTDDSQRCSAMFCRSCVRVESSAYSKFPCVLEDNQWQHTPEQDNEDCEIPSSPERNSFSSQETGVAPGRPAAVSRKEKRGAEEKDDLQTFFLDPTVRIFAEEELEGDSDEDEVDNRRTIVINNVTTTSSKGNTAKARSKTKSKSNGSSHRKSNHAQTKSGDEPDSGSRGQDDVTDRGSASSPSADERSYTLDKGKTSVDKRERSSSRHHASFGSSVDSDLFDNSYFSGSEQFPRSSPSVSPSELSSSFRSTIDSFPEQDLPETVSSAAVNDKNTEEVHPPPVVHSGSSLSLILSSIHDGLLEKQDEKPSKHESSSLETGKIETVSQTDHLFQEGQLIHRDPMTNPTNPFSDTSSDHEVNQTTDQDDASHTNADTITDVIKDSSDTASDVVDHTNNGNKSGISRDITGRSDVTDGANDRMPDVMDDVKDDVKDNVKDDVKDDVKDSGLDLDSVTYRQPVVPDSDTDVTSEVTDHVTDDRASPNDINARLIRDSTDCTVDQRLPMENFMNISEQAPEDPCHHGDDDDMELCTLCKENTPVDQLVTIPLDPAALIKDGVLQCWGSGIFLNHPEIFLVVSYRKLSDAIVVEVAVSPSSLGRRLLTFVVDHLDTLIKEWYPGLLVSYTAKPTVQKLIPCRSCEKSETTKLHKFTFDSCVTQYSMGDFVSCPRHEISIQDIAPDVVLNDIDGDLLLDEREIVYERTEANRIGSGYFGKVYRGRCRGRDAAIKEYSTPSAEEDALKRYAEVRKELNVLRRVGQHPYLVNLIGVCLRPFRLVLELAREGSLEKTLFRRDILIDRVVMYRMVYQVADAVSFLHSLKVIYRDLKPENVLVLSYEESADVNIKVTDFGTATFQDIEGSVALEGTVGFNAPEMLEEFSRRRRYDEKVDIFSLAMLIYGFITREKPYYHLTSQAEVNAAISSGKKPNYSDVTVARIGLAGLTYLMETCMEYDANARPYANAVANQVRSPPFQLLLGIMALPCTQSVRHVVVVESTRELWVAVDDKVANKVLIYTLEQMCLKKKFTVNRIRAEDPPVCMQVNCMHVTSTAVLIGLRGDLDVVTLHDFRTYGITAKISLSEPVFCLSSNDDYIFLGMSSGVVRIVPIGITGTPMTIEASDHPVNCMVAVDKFLWLTAAKCIHIFHTEEDEGMCAFELNSVRFNSSKTQCSHMVLSHDQSSMWCVSRGDSMITGWDVVKKDQICEVNCRTVLQSLSSEDKPLGPIETSITCLLPVLDTVWVGTGGGMLLVLDATSGELITWVYLLDDHVRTLTLIEGPGPCGTEQFFVVASGKNVIESALCRSGKVVCRLGKEKFKSTIAPPLPSKSPSKKIGGKSLIRAMSPTSFVQKSRSATPTLSGQRSDTEDGICDLPISNGSLLLVFEALPARVLRRIEAKSVA